MCSYWLSLVILAIIYNLIIIQQMILKFQHFPCIYTETQEVQLVSPEILLVNCSNTSLNLKILSTAIILELDILF